MLTLMQIKPPTDWCGGARGALIYLNEFFAYSVYKLSYFYKFVNVPICHILTNLRVV